MEHRRAYPSDLTDGQWEVLRPLLERPRRADGKGRPAVVDLREVTNAILYLLHEGCRWRALPHDFPAWQTVYWYFARWTDDGAWERALDVVRRQAREQSGRDPEPSAVVIDSQSVKTTEKGGTSATTPARRRRASSASSPSIPTDY